MAGFYFGTVLKRTFTLCSVTRDWASAALGSEIHPSGA